MKLLLLLLSVAAHADPPFYPRGTQTNQSIGGINQNFLDQTTRARDRLTTTITPKNCPAGTALTGAAYNNGYTFGGACQSFQVVGASTVATTSPISGTGTPANPIALTGAVPTNLLNLSTVPAAGACTLPNVVTATNAGAAPTCGQPSNVTGNAATVTTNANLTGPVTSVGNATSVPGPINNALTVTSTVTVGGYSGIPHMDTYANLKAAAVPGTAWFAYATDIKQFVFYTGNAATGDRGWFLQ